MSAKPMRVRRGREEDADTIAAFNRAMALETEGRDIPAGVLEAGVRGMLSNPDRGFYAVCEVDGELAGCLMITFEWSDWRNGVFWWIQSVYVATQFRRQGVYHALYDWVRERAAKSELVGEDRCCGFRLYVERDNLPAQQTYRALGMHECDYLMFEEERPTGGSS